MFAYIIRKYREESKLPLDLRSPLYNPKPKVFWDYVRSEEVIVDPEIFYIDHVPDYYQSNTYMEDFVKYNIVKNIYIGSLVAIIMSSKTFVYKRDNPRVKFRIFYGHCVWARPTVIQIRVRLVNAYFRMNFNFRAPNLMCIISLTPKYLLRHYNKHACLTYKIEDRLRRIRLSKKRKQK